MKQNWLFRINQKTVLFLNESYKNRNTAFLIFWILKPIVLYNLIKRFAFLFIKIFFKNSATADDVTPILSLTENQQPSPYITDGLLGLILFRKIKCGYEKPLAEYKARYDKNVFSITDFNFSQSATPHVSVIIYVSSPVNYVLTCLKSISDTCHVPIEIIVIKSPVGDYTQLDQINGLQIIDRKSDGILESYIAASQIAKGNFLCFLDDGTQVQTGWIEALIGVFNNFPDAGAAGSAILFPDLKLKMAGGAIFNDGTLKKTGNTRDPYNTAFRFLRPVDFCSVSLMVRKEEFTKNFASTNDSFATLYHDVDICLTITEKLNKTIYYAPSSVVIQENTPSAKDKKSIRDFNKKWNTVLSKKSSLPNNEYTALSKSCGKKTILIIDSYLPLYDKDSGSNRILWIIKILKLLQYHIIFLPDDQQKEMPYAQELQDSGVDVLYFTDKYQISVDKQLKARLASIDIAWICRPHLNEKYAPWLKRKDLRIIYDTVDLHFLRLQREEQITGKVTKWEDYKKTELMLCSKSDKVIAITDIDKDILLLNGVPEEKIETIPNIHVFKPSSNTFIERKGLLFIGSYVHAPNEDAVTWLCKEIMPLVWKSIPELEVTLLGSGVTKAVKSLESNNITVTGFVHDVSTFFNTHRVFVAPLRFGAGMKGKLGQSYEYGLPIVSTSIGIEGMGLFPEKNVLVADDKEEFAKQIIRLYTNVNLWDTLSGNSKMAIHSFSPESIQSKLDKLLTKI